MPVLDADRLTPQLEEFLRQLLKAARFDLKFQIRRPDADPRDPEAPELIVNFTGSDTDILLGHGGELLEALEELAQRVLRIETDHRARLSFDSNDFRSMREYELRLTAETAAEQAVKSGAPFSLNPMNSRDRRIVHLALKDNAAVRTESQGFGSRRNVVILPAGYTAPEKK